MACEAVTPIRLRPIASAEAASILFIDSFLSLFLSHMTPRRGGSELKSGNSGKGSPVTPMTVMPVTVTPSPVTVTPSPMAMAPAPMAMVPSAMMTVSPAHLLRLEPAGFVGRGDRRLGILVVAGELAGFGKRLGNKRCGAGGDRKCCRAGSDTESES